MDIKKAYVSLSLDFLLTSLYLYCFGVSFISWIKTFYKNITSSVAYNLTINEEFVRATHSHHPSLL